ncbi:MAG: hypothetical protein V1494_03280 [Candidatus Diapherotrites archaeon]
MKKIQTITFSEFKKLEIQDSYYKGRWPYFKEVIKIILAENPKEVLELGPYKRPIVKGSDIMDLNPQLTNIKCLREIQPA